VLALSAREREKAVTTKWDQDYWDEAYKSDHPGQMIQMDAEAERIAFWKLQGNILGSTAEER
jgi:hypothetical protein